MITSFDVYKYLNYHQKTPFVVIGFKKCTQFFFNNQGGWTCRQDENRF